MGEREGIRKKKPTAKIKINLLDEMQLRKGILFFFENKRRNLAGNNITLSEGREEWEKE